MCFCLCSEHTLCLVAVSFSLAVLLVGVLHRDVLVHEVLIVHVGNGIVRGFEVGVGYEAIAFGEVGFIAGKLGLSYERTETAKGVVKHSLVDHGVEVANEEFSTHFDGFLFVSAGLVDADGFAVEADLVHDTGGIVGVFFGVELDETIALVGLSDAVFGEVDVGYAAGLEEEFPDKSIGHSFVEVADVDGAVFVLLPVAGARHADEEWRILGEGRVVAVVDLWLWSAENNAMF